MHNYLLKKDGSLVLNKFRVQKKETVILFNGKYNAVVYRVTNARGETVKYFESRKEATKWAKQ
jgi:hypothetical protein